MAKPRKKPRPRPTPVTCPCGTGRAYGECCGALHSGARSAADAVELMRSRYAAFCLEKADYLWETLHSHHDERARDKAGYRAGVERSARVTRCRRMRVLDARPADADGVAQVLFHADARVGKLDRSFVELSTFVQEDGQWRYISGKTRPVRELAHGIDELSIEHWECDHDH